MTMSISSWCRMPMIIVSSSVTITTHFMELNTIRSIFVFSIESNMREIVPDRESYSTHNIREKELVEHEENPKW
jgi:hypothetical protein